MMMITGRIHIVRYMCVIILFYSISFSVNPKKTKKNQNQKKERKKVNDNNQCQKMDDNIGNKHTHI